jgi:hypothetical protein
MAAIVAGFKEALWFGEAKKTVCIDSWTFKLFNKVTSGLLVLGSVIVTSRQFFGEPIRCDAGAVRLTERMLGMDEGERETPLPFATNSRGTPSPP